MFAKKFSVTNHIVGVSAIVLCTIVGSLGAGWWRTYGGEQPEECNSLQQTTDGGFILAGDVQLQAPEYSEIWLVKTDLYGNTEWTKTYGYPGENYYSGADYANCIRQTIDGGYILVGTTSFGSNYNNKLWLMKLNSMGDSVWSRKFGDTAGGRWVEQTSDSGYIVIGTKKWSLWVIKTDINGDSIWTYEYQYSEGADGYCIQETRDGCFVFSGSAAEWVQDPGDWHNECISFFQKIDYSGNLMWHRELTRIRCEGSGPSGGPHCIRQTNDDGYAVLDGFDDQLVKTDSTGQILWSKFYGGEYIRSFVQTPDGGYILTGSRHVVTQWYNLWLIKTDENGEVMWYRHYGGKYHDAGFEVVSTNDGGYATCGFSEVPDETSYNKDYYLIKTDSLGLLSVDEEEPAPDVKPPFEILTPIGRTITLRAPECEGPLDLTVFDASGRKVNELILDASATITWGECYGAGVYFIRESSGKMPLTCKVILVK